MIPISLKFAKKRDAGLLPHPHGHVAEAKGPSSWMTSDGTWRTHARGAKGRTPARSSRPAAGRPSSGWSTRWCEFAG